MRYCSGSTGWLAVHRGLHCTGDSRFAKQLPLAQRPSLHPNWQSLSAAGRSSHDVRSPSFSVRGCAVQRAHRAHRAFSTTHPYRSQAGDRRPVPPFYASLVDQWPPMVLHEGALDLHAGLWVQSSPIGVAYLMDVRAVHASRSQTSHRHARALVQLAADVGQNDPLRFRHSHIRIGK